jgi:hypothetical protein
MPYQGTDVLPSLAKASQACTDLRCLALPPHAKPGLANACLADLCQAEPSKGKVPISSVPRHGLPYQGTNVLPSLARVKQAWTDLQCHALPSHATSGVANACLAALCQAEPSKAKFINAKAWHAIPRYRCVAKPRKGQPSPDRPSVACSALTSQARPRQRVPLRSMPRRAKQSQIHPCQGMVRHTKVPMCCQASQRLAMPAQTFIA